MLWVATWTHFGPFIAFHFGFTGQECIFKQMCQACPGCDLENLTHSKFSVLDYNFPVEAPIVVMHSNAYAAGKYASFEGS